MSLHNSTIIENQYMDFSNMVDWKWKRRAKDNWAPNVLFTNSKPSASGFEFEEEKRWGEGVKQTEPKAMDAWRNLPHRFDEGQAKKSARGMPWHQEPMKDVISCDKLRGAANEHWSGDFRMGKPTERYPALNQIGAGGEPPELKHLSRARKRHQPRFRE